MLQTLTLGEVLGLTGTLDDSPGPDTPRERFRRFLRTRVLDLAQVRAYTQEALTGHGTQSSRALADLVVHVGDLLGFQVRNGSYGPGTTQGHLDCLFDSQWISPSGARVVVGVKTHEGCTGGVRPFLEHLASLPLDDSSGGVALYVYARHEPHAAQVEDALPPASRLPLPLRTISLDGLFCLADLARQCSLTHTEVLALLRPSGPALDPMLTLVRRLATHH